MTLPITQINYYLYSKIFENFISLSKNQKPSKEDIEQMAMNIFASNQKDIKNLYKKLLENVKEGIGYKELEFYKGKYKELIPNPYLELKKYYFTQMQIGLDKVKANIEKLQNEEYSESYISRIHQYLQYIICGDKQRTARGPIFARDMMDIENTYSFIHIIKELQRENQARLEEEQEHYHKVIHKRYSKIEKKLYYHSDYFLFRSITLQYRRLENAMYREVQSQYQIQIYQMIDTLLNTLQKQILVAWESFYTILPRIIQNVNETF